MTSSKISSPNANAPDSSGALTTSPLGDRIDRVCTTFEERWLAGPPPRIADFLAEFAESEQSEALTALMEVDLWHRRRNGESPMARDYSSEFPQFQAAIEAVLTPESHARSSSTTSLRRSDQRTQIIPSDGMGTFATVPPAGPAPDSSTTPIASPATLQIGARLGDYEILRELGRGGMGIVYQARHRRMQRIVALKVLAPALASDAEALSRFRREVIAAASLTHPNIVMAFDAQEVDGIAFLVMEFVPGIDLASLVKQHGPLPVERAVDCVLQAARGLDYAHRRGVIHRDVKPHNLLLVSAGGETVEGGRAGDTATRDTHLGASHTHPDEAAASMTPPSAGPWQPGATVKILDMGLARLASADDSEASAALTTTGDVMGTVDYMAPEQALDTHRADARSDIYSLGCTLFYLLTGRTVYAVGSMMQKFVAHREGAIPSLPDLLPAAASRGVNTAPLDAAPLDAAFRRMVAKRPEDRFQSMRETIDALQAVSAKSPAEGSTTAVTAGDASLQAFLPTQPRENTTTRREPVAVRPSAASRRGGGRRIFLWGGLAGAVLILLGGIIIKITTRDGKTTTIEASDDAVVKVEQNGKTVGTFTPDDKSEEVSGGPKDVHRRVAETVLKRGGNVKVWKQGSPSTVTLNRPEDIPADSFVVVAISLAGRRVETEDLADLASIPYLYEIDLSSTRIVNNDLERLLDIDCGSWKLSGTDITDHGIRKLAERQDPQHLWLVGTSITDAACEMFARMPRLRVLWLTSTSVTDTGLAKLGGLPLRDLMSGRSCTATGAAHLKKTLVSLSLSKVTPQDVSIFADFPELRRLSVPGIPDAVARDLQAACPRAIVYHPAVPRNEAERNALRWCIEQGATSTGTDVSESFKTFRAVPDGPFHIREVRFPYDRSWDSGAANLTSLRSVEALSWPNLKLRDDDAQSIASLENLASLNLEFVDVSDEQLNHLTKLRQLENLMFKMQSTTADGLRSLTRLPYLRGLTLTNGDLDGTKLGEVARLNGLRSLSIIVCRLDSTDSLKELAKLEQLRSLRLYHTTVTDNALPHLARLTRLKFLDLRGTKLSASAVAELSKALPRCSILWTGGVALHDAATPGQEQAAARDPHRRAAEMVLKRGGTLNVRTTDRQLTISKLADVPRQPFVVTYVDLANRKDVTDTDLRELSSLYYLVHLVLAGTSVTDAGMTHLKNIDVQSLDLGDTAVGDSGIRQLSGHEDLSSLQLVRTPITDAACATVRQFSRLRLLNLSRTGVGDAGLKQLAGLKSLSRFHGGKGCTASALLPFQTLRRVGMDKVGMEDVEALAKLPGLRFVDLRDAPDDVVRKLHESLPGVRVLHPDVPTPDAERAGTRWALESGLSVSAVTAGGLSAPIDMLPELPFVVTGISRGENVVADPARLTAFRGLENLRWPKLENADVSARSIAALTGLRALRIPGSDMSDSGLVALTPLGDLEMLDLTGCKSVTENGWQRLESFPHLSQLILDSTSIGDAGLAQVGRQSELTLLLLDRCKNLTSGSLRHLAGLPVLRFLTLTNTSIDDEAVIRLSQLKSLRVLDVQRTNISLTGIEELQKALPQCAIFWDGGVAIPEARAPHPE
jgi:serine/threonine protein kinase